MIDKKALAHVLESKKKSAVERDFKRYRNTMLQYRALVDRMDKRFDERCQAEIKKLHFNQLGEAIMWIPSVRDAVLDGAAFKVTEEVSKEARKMINPAWRERLENEQKMLVKELRENPSGICAALFCTDFHVEHLVQNHKAIEKRIVEIENGERTLLPASAEEFETLLSICLAYVRNSGEAKAGYMHAAVLLDALGIEMPSGLRALQGDELVETVDEYRRGRWKSNIEAMKTTYGPDRLARLLVETLHPAEAAKIIEACAEKQFVLEPPPSDPMDELVERVRKITNYAKKEDVELFEKRFGPNPEKIATAVHWQGLTSFDMAVYIAEKGLGITGREAALLAVIEPYLTGIGFTFEDAEQSVRMLSDRQFVFAFAECGRKARGWLVVMSPSQKERGPLAALLASVAEAPESREQLKAVLEENDSGIVDAILENETYLGEYDAAYKELLAYAARFEKKNGLVPAERTEEDVKERIAEDVEIERPHESLAFSAAAEAAMLAENVNPEDARRAIAYGLRLSSSKAARGDKYFPVHFFRENTERVLEKNGDGIPVRRERIERFLAKHGVISYYKGGNAIRLNLKGGRDGKEPDAIGEDILHSTIRWMVEFQRNNI